MSPRPAKRRRSPIAAGAILALLAVGFGRFHGINGWDDTYYAGQLSSVVHDGDLDLRNDALSSGIAASEVARLLTAVLPNGALANTFSIGPALLWSPAYLLASIGARTRWGAAQLVALYLLSLVFCAVVAWAQMRLARRCGARLRDASWIGIALVVASPLLVYGLRVYTMSHLASAVSACWLLAALLALRRTAGAWWAMLAGVALGCLALVRWQDATFAILFLPPLATVARRGGPRRAVACLAAALAGCLPLVLLQSHAWWLERGRWLTVPQGESYLDLGRPQLIHFLFSGRSGLLPWMPLAAIAVAGFLVPWRSRLERSWRWSCLGLLVAQVWISAAAQDWWGGYSYGPRRLSSIVPVLAVGLANLSRAPIAGRGRRFRAILALTMVWGAFTAGLYGRRIQDLSPIFLGRVSTGTGSVHGAGLITDSATARRFALSSPFRPAAPNLFPGLRGGRALGLLLVFAVLTGTTAASARRPDRALAGTLLLYLGLACAAHVRLAFGPHPDQAERAAWRRFVKSDEVGAPTPATGPAVDAYRFLAAYRRLAHGHSLADDDPLCELAERQLNAARTLLKQHPETVCAPSPTRLRGISPAPGSPPTSGPAGTFRRPPS